MGHGTLSYLALRISLMEILKEEYYQQLKKIERGQYAKNVLGELKMAKERGDVETYEDLKKRFSDETFKNEYFRYFGYGFVDDPGKLIPNVPLSFYSFHLMVGLGFYFLLFFILAIFFAYRELWNAGSGFSV